MTERKDHAKTLYRLMKSVTDVLNEAAADGEVYGINIARDPTRGFFLEKLTVTVDVPPPNGMN